MKQIAELYKERATKANLPYPIIDAQAAGMVAAWQILEAGVNGAKSLDDKEIAAWLQEERACRHDLRHAALRRASTTTASRSAQGQAGAGRQVDGRLAEGVAAPGARLLPP